jgi:serine/threonine protein phosphatase 1
MRWVIGDIHGMLRPLERLLAVIARKDPDARLLFVGDYVNRGPDSSGVLDLLLTLDNARFVRGNHDDVLDQILHGESFTGERTADHRAQAFAWFMQHGLDATFRSYGAVDAELVRTLKAPTLNNIASLGSFVPENHKKFIRALKPTIEEEDLFVAHAKWDVHAQTERPHVAQRLTTAPIRYQLIWGRYTRDEIAADKKWGRTGYFGHTPVENYAEGDAAYLPLLGPKIVLLDTGVALSPMGRLTAFCHESSEYVQVEHNGDVAVPP